MSDDKFLGAYHAAMQSDFVVLPLAIANKIGLPETVLIKVVDNWCTSNQKHGKSHFYVMEEWWTQLSAEKIHADNPCIGSVPKIRRIIKKLESSQFLISFQSASINRAKFYRVNKMIIGSLFFPCDQNDQLERPCDQNDQMQVIKMIKPSDQNDQMIYINKLKIDSCNGLPTHTGKFSPPIHLPEPTEDSHTIAGKSQREQPPIGGQEEKIGSSAAAPRRGVQMTANPRTSNNDPDGLPSSKAAIAELGDKWEGFVDWLVKRSLGWDVADYGATDNLVARAKKIKRSYLVKQWERGNLINLCQQYLEENEAITQNQSREGGLNERVEDLVELHKTKPLEAVKLAKGDVRIYNKFMKEIVG